MFQEKINFEEGKSKALEFVRKNGPVMPSQVAKEIQIPPLFASALLSQLISEKVVKVSHLKIGGSPLYYVEGQKEKLFNFINNLPNVEKETCELLQKEGILQDEKLKLAEKVALRNIKDFSVALIVKRGEEKKLFWKWYALSREHVLEKISKVIKSYTKEAKEESAEDKVKVKAESKEAVVEVKEKPKIEVTEELPEKPLEEKEPEEKEFKKDGKIESPEFLKEIKEFLASSKVKILDEKVIRKNREIEFTLQLNSSLGKINFFAMARNKKVLTAADLTLAYYRSQEKKLPLILINSGRFAKNAEEKAIGLGITLKSLEEKQEK